MTVEQLPTLEEITKQLDEANVKKRNAQPEVTHVDEVGNEVVEEGEEVPPIDKIVDPNPEPEVEEVVAEPVKKEDQWSKRFAAVTRADKVRRQKEAELNQKMAEFDARMKSFEEKEARSLKVKSAREALKAHGFSYDDAVHETLGMPTEKEVDPVDEKVRGALDPLGQKLQTAEEKLAQVEDKIKYFEQLQQQQSEREVRWAIQSTAQDGEYKYIRELGNEAYENVYSLMVEYYEKHKQSLTYKQACDRVEGYYKRIADIGSTKADTVPGAKALKKPLSATVPPAKTLTQQHAAAPRSKQNLDDLSNEEAKKRLATMLKFR